MIGFSLLFFVKGYKGQLEKEGKLRFDEPRWKKPE
jgi:hypothetical protein